MEDLYEHQLSKGLTPAEAADKACEAMGSASQIAPKLAAIHRPFWGYLLRASRIALIVLLCLSVLPIWQYFSGLNLQEPKYQDYDVFNVQSYGGETGRTLHHFSQPELSFSTDGSTFTLTDAVVYTDHARDRTYLYVLIEQTNPMPWSEHDEYFYYFTISGWFTARDSLGNTYCSYMSDFSPNDKLFIPGGSQTGIFTYTHMCWINDFPADAKWVEICYQRDGRDFSMRIDLTGGGNK